VAPAQASQLGARTSLRSYLEALVVKQRGSAIVIDPATGEIQAAWNLQAAVENAYPPGSTAKIVEATAALEEDLFAPGDRIMCQGVPPLQPRSIRTVASAPQRTGSANNTCKRNDRRAG
jgi:cell division protein FtsI/penicillin-binding protein 2